MSPRIVQSLWEGAEGKPVRSSAVNQHSGLNPVGEPATSNQPSSPEVMGVSAMSKSSV